MTLLRVVAEMATPLAGSARLNLDGLLIAAAAGPKPLGRGEPLPVIPPMPLSRIEHDGEWVFATSNIGFPRGAKRTQTGMTAKRDGEDYWWLRRKVVVGGGPSKDRMKPVTLTVSADAGWLVHGDRAEITSLLDRITSLGALRAHGYGRIRRWIVRDLGDAPAEDAVSGDGIALRHLPAAWNAISDSPRLRLPVRPPYWHRGNLVEATPAGEPFAWH